MMIVGAGVLAMLVLACMGAAAGATWVVSGDDGGADFVSIQAAVGAASEGDSIEVGGRANARECGFQGDVCEGCAVK